MKPSLIAVMLIAVALAGCTGAEDTGTDTTIDASTIVVRIPMGAAASDAGLAFVIDEPAPSQPTMVRWINEDVITHPIMAMGTSASEGSAPSAPADDGHDDHDHGPAVTSDASSGILFSFSLGPGASVDVPFDATGIVTVHCTQHDWLQAQWWAGETGFQDARPYWTVLQSTVVRQNSTGDTDAGDSVETAWDLPGPGLKHLEVLLSWDDSEDDTAAGSDVNPADTLTVSILDPSGTVVAESTEESRDGSLVATFDAPERVWPEAVFGKSMEEAEAALDAGWPVDTSLAGNWSVVVTVDAAPGAWPDGSPDLPGSDGHQAWTLMMISEHETVTLADAAPAMDHDHSGHEH